DRGFLWRIEKGGHSSWLYGTLHVGRAAWTTPGPRTAAALAASQVLALELDLLDPAMQQRMAQAMLSALNTPAPYASVASLPPELRERLRPLAEAACLPEGSDVMLSPALEIALLGAAAVQGDGLRAEHGIDLALARRARDAGRTIVSLETPEAQIAAMQPSGSAAETLEFVGRSLDELEAGRARTLLLRTAQVWADGDWAALAGYAAWCDCLNTAADRADMARLLDQRNPAMAAAIDALHAGGQRVFAAVGSLHLTGPQGLPALLARRGYRVERITFDKIQETTR
ncbi:MAG TPA: TraB/GumN family protein, partial [Burkholderiaceae bacterium]|nr:TraB/GumN family protein [Burkholderiaceae bacterium]